MNGNPLYKGSRRCILEFVSDADFINNINLLICCSNAIINKNDVWFPKGLNNDKEAELKDFLKTEFNANLGNQINNWWLSVSTDKTKTPNWDMLSTCSINNKKGLLLVEAKAHCEELSYESKGKSDASKESDNSKKNHGKIGKAIQEVNDSISILFPGVSISRDKCYQLSNRIAHAWWLSNQGIPVVLLYLGFLNAYDMNVGKNKLFKTENDWISCFNTHSKQVGVDKIINKWVYCGNESFKIIVKSY